MTNIENADINLARNTQSSMVFCCRTCEKTKPYDSFDHPNFIKVWSPENIRPLRADINIKEGTGRVRHIAKKVGK
jgi:hypothetical protein